MQSLSRRAVGATRLLKPGFTTPPAVWPRVGLATTSSPANAAADDKGKKGSGGLLKSILHGSEKAKQEAPSLDDGNDAGHASSGQHSHIIGRGKYIHEVSKHKVKPGRVEEYKELVAGYYSHLAERSDVDIKLTGSWEVVVGDLDIFYHIWEHTGFRGFDAVTPQIKATQEYKDFMKKLAPMIQFRTSKLVQEFSFWPSSPPKQLGGVYEMRTYDLKPGTLLEWEQEWKIGLEARRKFVEPIGAWFTQIGQLHQVIHMWHYDSLEARKQMRQKAWEIDTWSNTVAKTVKLANHMTAQVLQPLPFSPLR